MSQEQGPGERGTVLVKAFLRLFQIGALQGLIELLGGNGESDQEQHNHGAEQDKVPPKKGKPRQKPAIKLTHILTSFQINPHYKT